MNRFFAPGEEFALIERLFPPERFGRDGRALGDDAFLFEPAPKSLWAVTSDSSAEGVHYRLNWASPERALRKALLANLSDINAMGGRPRHAFFNLGARREWGGEVFDALGQALRELEKTWGFQVSGGDTVRIDGASFFAFTVLGEVKGRPLLRSGCRPGHRIYVSGTLGGSAGGLKSLEQGKGPGSVLERGMALITAHLDPAPPLELGPALSALGKPIGAIDISDGLSSELWHLARQSGFAFRVEWSKLPIHPTLRDWGDAGEIRRFVLDGGEEYQLLFTGDFSASELGGLRSVAPISEIGVVEKGDGVFLGEEGRISALPAGGFSH